MTGVHRFTRLPIWVDVIGLRLFLKRVEHYFDGDENLPDGFAKRVDTKYPAIMFKIISRMTLLAVLAGGLPMRADQVVMQNGDTLHGTVLSVSTNTLVLQNENLGRVALPRAKVAAIVLGKSPPKAGTPLPAAAEASLPITGPATDQTNSAADLMSALRGLSGQTNLVQQVEAQFLAPAGPEAVNKFNQLLDGLSTGKIDMNDLRTQAQSAADQLRSLKQGLGPDDSGAMDAYLAILNDFLRETAPTNAATSPVSPPTNAPPAASPTGP